MKKVFAILLLTMLLFVGCAQQPAETPAPSSTHTPSPPETPGPGPTLKTTPREVSGIIDKDMTWSGYILITGKVTVAKGVNLTIDPGTIVRFKHWRPGYADPRRRIQLNIDGTLRAVGTPQEPIRFTSDVPEPEHSDWMGINFNLSSGGSIMDSCIVEFGRRLATKGVAPSPASESSETPNRVVVAGYGRIGQNIAQGLHDAGIPYIIIDIDPERISEARSSGKPRIYGDASNIHILSKVDLAKASTLVVTFPDPLAVVATVKTALEINPKLNIVARIHRTREAGLLKTMGKVELISPEYEASLEFLKRILVVSGWKKADIRQTLPVVEQDQEFVEFSSDEEELW